MYDTDTERARLDAHIVYLTKRLDLGLPKIQDGLAAGKDVRAWEDKWIELLGEYEQTFDKLAELEAAHD